MYKSFESTNHYRPLLPQKSHKWKLIIAIVLLIIGISGFFVVNPGLFKSKPYIPEKATTFKDQAILLMIENNNLKSQLTNYQVTLTKLTNTIEEIESLRRSGHTNNLTLLSNLIEVVSESAKTKELLIAGEMEKVALYQQLEKLTNK